MARGSALEIAAAVTLLAYPVQGHMMQQFPESRQFSWSPWGGKNGVDFPDIENAPYSFNAGGVKRVQARAYDKVSAEVMEAHGGGEVFPLLYADFADNGNMLESEEMSKRHGVCGDPKINRDDDTMPYSTPNIDWPVMRSFESGQVIEMDIVVVYYHWGHVEFSLCDANDLDDPDGVITQECLNMHPLTRAPGDDDASPIDPDYPGRFYVGPPCMADETEQNVGDGLPDGSYSVKMRYLLPDIECSHCVLRMHYFTGHLCKHIGYDEFNPTSWPSQCAPDKSDWVVTDSDYMNMGICGISTSYPEEFWNCSDIEIKKGSSTTRQSADDDPEVQEDEEAFFYRGCFADQKTNRIMERVPLSTEDEASMTAELCMGICEGYKYFGTQWGKECWCGGDDTDHLQHGESEECDSPCTGDEDEICGGYDCMTVYSFTQ